VIGDFKRKYRKEAEHCTGVKFGKLWTWHFAFRHGRYLFVLSFFMAPALYGANPVCKSDDGLSISPCGVDINLY